MSNDNEDRGFRGFYHWSTSWYAKGDGPARDKTDSVAFGIYHEGGGTSGEMCMEWQLLCGKDTPKLVAFSDAWRVLGDMPDLLIALAAVDSQDITPFDFCALLRRLGFKDLTERVCPLESREQRICQQCGQSIEEATE